MNRHGARRIAQQASEIRFSFDGQSIAGVAGDTVASALMAAGVRAFATDPHDGSPRGGFCFVGRCSDCLMVIDGQPGTMACMTQVRDGMEVEFQRGLGHWTPRDDS